MKSQRYAKYLKFTLYLAVVVLLNLAARTVYTRIDLTDHQIYSLSGISRKVVATLSEPLTIKVFFTQELPAPHNSTELYLQDLLKEYALHGNKQFNYRFYNVSPETEGLGDNTRANRDMARDYGIDPIQIQVFEKDAVKFKQAYMGMVLIHGDIVERIPTITSTDGLEYKITTAIQKLNNKVSAFLGLTENVQVKLVLSSSLYKVAPYMNIAALKAYPDKVKEIVARLNPKVYGKLSFSYVDPSTDGGAAAFLQKHNIMQLNWPAIPDANVPAGEGAIGMVLQYQQQVREIPLLNVVRLPIFGTQYQLAELDQIEEIINANLERLVNINEDLGYLADFGTLNLHGMGPFGPPGVESLDRFNELVSRNYSLKSIEVGQNEVSPGLKTLVIANPTEKFSDYALYQIDQALMRGTNLAIFTDVFKETQVPGQQPFMANQAPTYLPFDSGLEKLLEHYGLRIRKSLVLDEKCYNQRLPQQQGGGERPIYFAPIIQKENINQQLEYLRNIKGLVAVKASPLELDQKRIEAQQLTAHQLFASSKRSWEIRDRITLNPMFMQPPSSDKEMESLPLAYLVEGRFESYFKGKPMPEKPAPAEEATEGQDAQGEGQPETAPPADRPDLSQITGQGTFGEQSPPAKILLVGSSEVLKNNLLDEEGQSTNAMFVLNMIDALNGREAVGVLRSKVQRFNPVAETEALTKTVIKAANMIGLPILVVIFGGMVWMRRRARRKRIQLLFQN
jgi:ABC-2 type transport system permease protein